MAAWFSNPLLLGALAALAIPVWLHLIEREDRRGKAFPSLMFVARIRVEMRRRLRLRDRGLLALRCLALALAVLAFARPQLFGVAAVLEEATRDTVIVLDLSFSMQAGDRWTRALERARTRVSEAGSGRVGLVGFGLGARVLRPLEHDRDGLRALLAGLEPGEPASNLTAALSTATRMLLDGGAAEQHLILVSDLQQSMVLAMDPVRLPASVVLDVEAVAAPGTPAIRNLAIRSARLDVPPASEGVRAGPHRLLVTVASTGNRPAGEAVVQLRSGGRLQQQPVSADGRDPVQVAFELPAMGEQAMPVVVELLGADTGSGVTADDRHAVVLAGRRPVRVVWMTPRPGRDSSPFLRAALDLLNAPRAEATQAAIGRLADAALAEADVVVVTGTSTLSPPELQALSDHAARGGGIIWFAHAGQTTTLADRARWPAILPGAGTSAPRVVRKGGERYLVEAGDALPGEAVSFAPVSRLVERAGVELEVATMLEVSTLARRASTAGEPEDRVLLRLHDGTPLLLTRAVGAGRVVLIAADLDPRASNLPVSALFVPLVEAAVRYASGRGAVRPSHRAGEVIDLPALAARVAGQMQWDAYARKGGRFVVLEPDGVRRRLDTGVALYRPREPGVHEVRRADGTGKAVPFAINADPGESLLEAASEAALLERIARAPAARTTAPGAAGVPRDQPPPPLAWYLLALAALGFVGESLWGNRVRLASGPATAPADRATS